MMARRVFTLIELLVVVAIIAILAAMLLPSLSKARDRVRMDVCNNNLRTFGVAWDMYCDENAEFLPLNTATGCPTQRATANLGGANPDFKCYWAYKLWPFINDKRFFLCTDRECAEFTLQHPTFPRYVATTYGTNCDMEGVTPCNRRTRIVQNSTLILLGHADRCCSPMDDFVGSHNLNGTPKWAFWPGWHGPNLDGAVWSDVHMLGKDGFLIADGHIEVYGWEILVARPDYWHY